ncbi:MAG: aminotransferase class V-fold PLP-dependent enzyme [Candidatus Methanofastidiosia archaeon]
MVFDVERVREDFPLVKKIIYFDNAATSLTPKPVVDAISEYYLEYRANVHRGVHRLSERASLKYEEAREKVADFIGASFEEIIFVRNTTEALNAVAYGLSFERGDRVLVSELEHHSNLLPFMRLRARGVEVEVLGIDSKGRIDFEDLEEKIVGAKLLTLSHVSNVFGTIAPIEKISKLARENDCLLCIDAAQAVGHLEVDVKEMGCDFLAFSGHKGTLGPTGIGVLHLREELQDEFEPVFLGGGMIEDVTLKSYKITKSPERYEAGTPNIGGAIGLGAGIRYLERIGVENVKTHERKLTEYTLKRLDEIEGLKWYGPLERTGVISFNLGEMNSHDLAAILDERARIMVRSGHHCAIPLMRALGVDGMVRASYHIYNTTEEIEKMIEVLREVSGFL